jgi:hypothetical protein
MKWTWTVLASAITYLFLTTITASEEQKPTTVGEEFLTRSLYVPIHFRVCKHLLDAVLYDREQLVGALPIERTFQFTYYPKLERWLPERIDVKIKGVRAEDEEPFLGWFAVTFEGIYTALTEVKLDVEWAKKKLTYKRDARYKTTRLFVRHSNDCDQRATDKPDKEKTDEIDGDDRS